MANLLVKYVDNLDHPILVTVPERVDYIARLMSANQYPPQWQSRAFRTRLGAVWGVTAETVGKYAHEAHRRVSLQPEDLEILKEDLATTLHEIGIAAANERSRVTGLPDTAGACKALELAGKYAGIADEQNVRLSGTVALEDLAAMQARLAAPPADDDE